MSTAPWLAWEYSKDTLVPVASGWCNRELHQGPDGLLAPVETWTVGFGRSARSRLAPTNQRCQRPQAKPPKPPSDRTVQIGTYAPFCPRTAHLSGREGLRPIAATWDDVQSGALSLEPPPTLIQGVSTETAPGTYLR